MTILYCYLLLINALGIVFMLLDKRRAVKNMWRIPEKVLLLIVILGGSIGSLMGMRVIHHKTNKPLFSVGIPLMCCLHILMLVLIHSRL
jgi:uncharacterized membrane protein YsdA (DUF1294 family)